MNKIERIKEILASVGVEVQQESREGGGTWLVGPYPSFIMMFDSPTESDGFIISLNSDPAATVYTMMAVLKEFPDLQHYGPYCEDLEGGMIHGGQDAYKKREDFILQHAASILAKRKMSDAGVGLVMPQEKKIILER